MVGSRRKVTGATPQGRKRKLQSSTESSRAEVHRQTRKAHGSEIAEDYVEVIAELIADRGEARAVDISRQLGVTHVTVTKTVSRLQRDGLVTTEPYRSIFLTEEGEAMARRCQQRHETVYEFLLAIGVPERVAEIDAEGIEHHVSDETLKVFRSFRKPRNQSRT